MFPTLNMSSYRTDSTVHRGAKSGGRVGGSVNGCNVSGMFYFVSTLQWYDAVPWACVEHLHFGSPLYATLRFLDLTPTSK